MRPRLILEVRRSPKTGWFWRAKRANGRIVATAGERFTRKPDAIRAAHHFVGAVATAGILAMRHGKATIRLDVHSPSGAVESFDLFARKGKLAAASQARRLASVGKAVKA